VKPPATAAIGGTPARRRAISVGATFAALATVLLGAPLLYLAAAVVDLCTPRRSWPHVRLLTMVVLALGIETAGILACGALWILTAGGRVVDRRWAQHLHFQVQHWWAGALLSAAEKTVRLRVEVEVPDAAQHGNVIVLGRHVSIGDATIPAALLGHRYRLETRYVLKHDLAWGPCIDIIGHRLPHHFVDRHGDSEVEAAAIRRVATGMSVRSAAVIFPEGTFFSPERKARAVARLAAGTRPDLAARAARLQHLLPPRPAGTLALLDGAPHADVLILGHLGFEQFTSLGAIVRRVPFDEPIRVWLRRIPRADVPRTIEARITWLYDEWERLDASIDRRLRERAPRAAIG
jgi:1-acyl-sn-glycerol-3-phosphate acyltransferase